jgi:hypothetical protein
LKVFGAWCGVERFDGVGHVGGVPDHDGVEDEAERGELVFLALPVALAQPSALAVEEVARDAVAVLMFLELDGHVGAVGVVGEHREEVQGLGDSAVFGQRAPEAGRAALALEHAQDPGSAGGAGDGLGMRVGAGSAAAAIGLSYARVHRVREDRRRFGGAGAWENDRDDGHRRAGPAAARSADLGHRSLQFPLRLLHAPRGLRARLRVPRARRASDV